MAKPQDFKVGKTVYIKGDSSSPPWRVIAHTHGGQVMVSYNGDTRLFDPVHLSLELAELPQLEPGDQVEVRWFIDDKIEWWLATVLAVADTPEYDEDTRILVEYDSWYAPGTDEKMQMKHRIGRGIRHHMNGKKPVDENAEKNG